MSAAVILEGAWKFRYEWAIEYLHSEGSFTPEAKHVEKELGSRRAARRLAKIRKGQGWRNVRVIRRLVETTWEYETGKQVKP